MSNWVHVGVTGCGWVGKMARPIDNILFSITQLSDSINMTLSVRKTDMELTL